MRIFISFILLITFSNLYAATITAELDINPVLVNDTFHLTYTASGSVDDDPDFGPIEAMFDVLGTQQSSNMSMINGNITRSKTWRLTLISKATGTFIIPAISFGTDLSAEAKVIVKDIPVSNGTTPNQNFILEMAPSQKSGFVQQQFIITVKLLIAQNINNYQFSDLSTSNSDTQVFPLGKDQQYKTYRGTKQYIVIEKQFALFPQTAGTLKINPFIAAVTISSPSGGGFYDPFNTRATSKRLYTNAVDLTVKDIPAQYSHKNWLPSTSVTLKEEWPENKKIIAGEPVTRTLILEANGLTSSRLPEISQPAINGLKQYPDKPELQENIIATGLTSTRKQKIALIPTQAGSYTLPEMNIAWWNTKTNKVEIAHLPKRSFTVSAALHNTANLSPRSNPPATAEIIDAPEKVIANVKKATPYNDSVWFWLTVLFFVLWLLTLTLYWRTKSKLILKSTNTKKITPTISRCLKQLKTACEKNDAQETKTALLEWARLVFPDTQVHNLSEIENLVSDSLKQDIMSLNAFLYNPNITEWKCDDLYKKCKQHKKLNTQTKLNDNTAVLEPLNRTDI